MRPSPRVHMLLALLLLAGVAGCEVVGFRQTAVDYKKGYDFSGVQRVGFAPRSADSPTVEGLGEQQQARIDQALAQALTERGFSVIEDASQADIILSWHLVAREKADVRSYNSNSYYQCWRCGPAISDIEVSPYTEGTLIVDMIDPALRKSVWRGMVQDRIDPNLENIGQQELLLDVARQALSKFPP